MKAYALQSGLSRLTYLENHLTGRDFLLDRFSVADAYLVTVLNWTMVLLEIDLNNWPAMQGLSQAPARTAEHRARGH